MTDWGSCAVGLEQRLLARFRSAGIATEAPLIVAFSGGPDSLALAAALTHVRAVTGLPLLLIHVDHRLRESSGEEAEAAVDLSRQLGVDMLVRRVPVVPHEAHPNVGIEEAARRERYRLLREEATRIGAQCIVTGHHREDQAETVLLHLLRGSGLRGASGMAEVADLPDASIVGASRWQFEYSLRLWRPFLHEPRRELLAYLKSRGLTPLYDPSNDDLTFRRNALRHRVLPDMEATFPGAAAALARYASLAAEEDRFLEDIVDHSLPLMIGPHGGLRQATLLDEAPVLQRRLLRRWLVQSTKETDIGTERVEAVLRWVKTTTSAGEIQLPGEWSVRRAGEWLIVARQERALDRGGSRG